MLFPTVEYAVFFLTVLAIAWAIESHRRAHKAFLLLASYIFYGFWSWRYVPLLIALSLFATLIAHRIQHTESERQRKTLLITGVVLCLATLAYYKYASFVVLSALGLWGLIGRTPVWNLPTPFLPLGISFFVFHCISLMGDVYRRKLRDPLFITDGLLYIAFFPQLIAGPILRASHFIPQLMRPAWKRWVDTRHIRVNRAFLLILSGLFKKVILSNTLATRLVEPVFLAPMNFHRGDVLFAIYGYAAQIYCDFSGYTDIATGCALLLGYHFPRNFNAPYTAADPQDFWRRWHISLSSWLRDYLYIPLGGNRGSSLRICTNLMITMLLGGLWHGASWTFVAWGALHGSYLITHRIWSRSSSPQIQTLRTNKAWLWFSRILLFHAVCLAWVLFRASSFHMAAVTLSRFTSRGYPTLLTIPVILTLALGLLAQYAPRNLRRGTETVMSWMPAVTTGAFFALGIALIELLGPSGVAPFIYFQF